jgi:hypothetical protein
VAAVEPCGRQSVKVTEQAPDGKQYTRRFLGTRLVCILPAEPAPQFPPSLTATGVGDGLKGY